MYTRYHNLNALRKPSDRLQQGGIPKSYGGSVTYQEEPSLSAALSEPIGPFAFPDPMGITALPATEAPAQELHESTAAEQLKTLLSGLQLSAPELLLITLAVYFLTSHADDGMAILLLLLLVMGLGQEKSEE